MGLAPAGKWDWQGVRVAREVAMKRPASGKARRPGPSMVNWGYLLAEAGAILTNGGGRVVNARVQEKCAPSRGRRRRIDALGRRGWSPP